MGEVFVQSGRSRATWAIRLDLFYFRRTNIRHSSLTTNGEQSTLESLNNRKKSALIRPSRLAQLSWRKNGREPYWFRRKGFMNTEMFSRPLFVEPIVSNQVFEKWAKTGRASTHIWQTQVEPLLWRVLATDTLIIFHYLNYISIIYVGRIWKHLPPSKNWHIVTLKLYIFS